MTLGELAKRLIEIDEMRSTARLAVYVDGIKHTVELTGDFLHHGETYLRAEDITTALSAELDALREVEAAALALAREVESYTDGLPPGQHEHAKRRLGYEIGALFDALEGDKQ